MSIAVTELASRFYAEQDRLHHAPRDLVTDDYRIVIGSAQPMDVTAHDAYAGAFFTACPDLAQQVVDSIAQGDRVAVRLRVSGTNTGPFMGQEPTGRAFTITALAFITTRDGKISEIRVLSDDAALMAQLSGT